MNIRIVLLIASIVLFVLIGVGVDNDTVHLGWIGLALFAGSFLPLDDWSHRG